MVVGWELAKALKKRWDLALYTARIRVIRHARKEETMRKRRICLLHAGNVQESSLVGKKDTKLARTLDSMKR